VIDPPEETNEMDQWILACKALMKADVRFLIVGAFGAELHFLHGTLQILTRDMDLLLPRDPAEVLRGLLALRDAGFTLEAGGDQLLPDEVVAAGIVRQSATVKARRGPEWVDLMTWSRDIEFSELWPRRVPFMVRDIEVPVAPLADILRSKKGAYRMKDRMFLEQFKEVIGEALERERKRENRQPPAGPLPPD
jgi:hypothetical protein